MERRPAPLAPRHRHSPVDACIAVAIGEDPFAPPFPDPPLRRSPRAALEAVVLEHLRRPPCLVSFSGGRDSSTVLAIAAHVARREGLPLPIPATNRFPDAPESEEAEWQELAVRALGLDDWIHLEWTGELDVIGPYAQRVLRRHGLVVPFNAHFQEPIMERAAGGSLLTGVGGDELLGPALRPLATDLLFRRRRPARRRFPELALELAPHAVRRAAFERDGTIASMRWLQPAALRYFAREYAEVTAAHPLRFDRWTRWWWRRRSYQAVQAGMSAMGADHDVVVASPFSHPHVLAAYATVAGAAGIRSRSDALCELVGDLLPESLLRRRTKASFDPPFFHDHSRRFAAGWAGDGVDEDMVSPERLRDEWLSERPNPHSFVLLQQAWLQGQAAASGRESRSRQLA